MSVIDMTNETNRIGVRAATALTALRFEVRTGMKMCRIPVLPVANEIMGTNYRTKAKALAALEDWYTDFQNANYEPSYRNGGPA